MATSSLNCAFASAVPYSNVPSRVLVQNMNVAPVAVFVARKWYLSHALPNRRAGLCYTAHKHAYMRIYTSNICRTYARMRLRQRDGSTVLDGGVLQGPTLLRRVLESDASAEALAAGESLYASKSRKTPLVWHMLC